jgi:DNA recombination protein RmuC
MLEAAIWPWGLAAFVVGLTIGFLLHVILNRRNKQQVDEIARSLFQSTKEQSQAEMNALLESTKAVFRELSSDTLQRSTSELLKLAESTLSGQNKLSSQELQTKKELIDQQLTKMTAELEKVATMVSDYEKDRSQKFGELNRGIQAITKQTDDLTSTTNALKEALSSSQARGQWGQRMADDVLHLAGLEEGINYRQQQTRSDSGQRPDYTFFLPNNQSVNMDVKFPLDNYLRYLEAETDADRSQYSRAFMKDVRTHIKDLSSREYIAADGGTVEYVFIPNESVYSFIHQNDPRILDDALAARVILCSPMTLFAVLAVIRQSVENFAMQQTSSEMLSLFGNFRKQWDAFIVALEKLGERIGALQKEYVALTTTRRNQLERPLTRIEDLHAQHAKPVQLEPGAEQDEDE